MAAVTPVAKEHGAEAARPIFDELAKRHGRVPNVFAVMAHRPEVLKVSQINDGLPVEPDLG